MVTYTVLYSIPQEIESSRYLFSIIIYPLCGWGLSLIPYYIILYLSFALMNHIIPLIVPLLQEFFLANRVGDHNSQEVNIQIQQC